jgi:hypothetical protein
MMPFQFTAKRLRPRAQGCFNPGKVRLQQPGTGCDQVSQRSRPMVVSMLWKDSFFQPETRSVHLTQPRCGWVP